MITITTPACTLCHAQTVLQITQEELNALNSGAYIQDALPTRDAAFREMVKSGIHGECWDSMTLPVDEEEYEEELDVEELFV